MKRSTDDELDDLPPLDGADGEDEGAVDEVDDVGIPDGANGLFDDAQADDLDIGEPIATEDADADPADEAWDGDTGDPDLVGDEQTPLRPEDDEPGLEDREMEIDDEPDAAHGDIGEDGPTDSGDLAIEGELPSIDADDEGDFEQTLLRDTELPDGLRPRASGAEMVGRDVHTIPWPEGTLENDAVVIDARRFDGIVLVGSTTGVRRVDCRGLLEPCNLWRELPGAERFFEGTEVLCAALGPNGVLWLATPGGRLLRGESGGDVWEDLGPLLRTVRALHVRVDHTVSAVCTDRPELSLISSADGRAWFDRPLSFSSAPYRRGTTWLAQSGVAVAIGHDRAGVLVSRDGGQSYRPIAVPGAMAGAFAGEGTWAPLVVACSDQERGALRLLRVEADCAVEPIADLESGVDDDSTGGGCERVVLAWDGEREWLWAFAGARLTALARRQLQ